MNYAILGNEKNFTVFKYGNRIIRFKAPYSLEKYTEIKEWDHGYLVVMAKYKHNKESEEEYIDLISILENLYISPEEWLQFVVDCRRGIEHTYDIVEGPMADDQVWDYVEDYVAGNISKAAFWKLVKFKYPTHQIVFCTEQALETISFEGSENL